MNNKPPYNLSKFNTSFLLVLFLPLFIGCKNSQQTEEIDLNNLNIKTSIITSIAKEANKNSVPFSKEIWKYDKTGNEEHYTLDTGVVFKSIDEKTANTIFTKYHKQVENSKNYLFLTNMDFDEQFQTFYDIVIINKSDPLDIIELYGTCGVNYDIYTNDIVSFIKKWNSTINLQIDVIQEDRIQGRMNSLPQNLEQFANDVYTFCPDVIDQGYGSKEEMIQDYRSNRYFWVWWD